ncbi:Band 7 protein [Penicillium cosmopolitanum]|uniref:Band 7 protein n=1 Tax=Penicillium cosmopolitanum TaxID=1131564 RepID=A0A9X0BE64_9EURO|nr:Band 7 protein [Penicillium cosmopolitanum]KAJ5413748.1 Band 7 protein [Penicillium cosmopolitanum]
MSLNGATSNGKTPVHERDAHAAYYERRLVNVQPARLDDLQPKYAQTINHDDDNPDVHGCFERSVDPGLVKVNPLSEHLRTVDVKIQIVEVPRQVYVRLALVERTQTALRHVIGARILQDVIERREEIAQSTSEIIEEVAAGWGVQVESMLIKAIILHLP